MMNELSKEIETYNKILPELSPDEGKFAVIFKTDLIGVYSAYEDALNAGYEKAKLDQFLVKKISGNESVSFFSRDLKLECPISQ